MMERAGRVGHVCVIQVRTCVWRKYFGTTCEEGKSNLSPGGYAKLKFSKWMNTEHRYTTAAVYCCHSSGLLNELVTG